ncbi:hypothetical protein [Streptomyces sp. NPDC017991]|uniref:hypothetical protein n=1 Tax=Streptomyces sp. NPDC017991 TaxID=3365026 RepID=UPI00378E1308
MKKTFLAAVGVTASLAVGAFFVVPNLMDEEPKKTTAEISSQFFTSIDPEALESLQGLALSSDFEVSSTNSVVLAGAQRNLTDSGFNDKVSTVMNLGDTTYCLYHDTDFQGSPFEIAPRATIVFEGGFASHNDKMSSMKPC